MKRTIIVALAAAALLGSGPARAYDLNITMVPYSKFGQTSAKIVNVPGPATDAERAAFQVSDDKWAKFCQPTKTLDAMGMTHLHYAHEGCEFGRSE
jgi:hypothetical protein